MDTQLADLMVVVARVDANVRACRVDIQRLHDAHLKRLNNQNNRIDSLERTRDIQKGASKILAGLAAVGGSGGLFSYFKFWS